MNSIFGDATTVMPTPEGRTEVESLFSGQRSPVGSLDIRQGPGADAAIPGLDINPPALEVRDGQPVYKRQGSERSQPGEGLGGWISNIAKRAKGGDDASGSGKYKRIEQDDD